MRTAAIFGLMCALAAAPFALAPAASAQQSQQAEEKTQNDTFSGNIVELSADKLTVSRSILGGKAEKRTFLINSSTKIEGKLRVKAKVTVGYNTTDDGDVARLIMVRQPRR